MKELFKTDDGRFIDLNDIVEFPSTKDAETHMELNGGVEMVKQSGYLCTVSIGDYRKIYNNLR